MSPHCLGRLGARVAPLPSSLYCAVRRQCRVSCGANHQLPSQRSWVGGQSGAEQSEYAGVVRRIPSARQVSAASAVYTEPLVVQHSLRCAPRASRRSRCPSHALPSAQRPSSRPTTPAGCSPRDAPSCSAWPSAYSQRADYGLGMASVPFLHRVATRWGAGSAPPRSSTTRWSRRPKAGLRTLPRLAVPSPGQSVP